MGDAHAFIADHGSISAPVIVIAPNIEHQLMSGEVLLIYLEPESAIGHVLAQRCINGYLLFDDATRQGLLAATHNHDGKQWLPGIVANLDILPPPADANLPTDRIERIIAQLARRTELPKTLTQFAREASLSPSRLRHRIVSSVGMPFRSYVRWLRLQRALAFAAAGASLTEASIAADFADAAHLTRNMRPHFGIAPRDIVKALR